MAIVSDLRAEDGDVEGVGSVQGSDLWGAVGATGGGGAGVEGWAEAQRVRCGERVRY
jgi:hypothetical protein